MIGGEIEVDLQLPSGEVSVFDIKFGKSGDRRSFVIGIDHGRGKMWTDNSESSEVVFQAASDLAHALIKKDTDGVADRRFLFGNSAPATLEGTLQNIATGVGGIDRWVWPEESH
jgi:hypothetical protein